MPVTIEQVPELVARTWRDLSWERETIPPQGMDHAVVMLNGLRSGEGELADMVPETVVARVPYEAEYRDQAMLESSLIAQLFRGTKVRVPETVRQAYARGTFHTGDPIMLTLQTVVTGSALDAATWATLTDAQRATVAEQLGSLLGTMHSMNPDLLPLSTVESWWTDGAETAQLSTNARTLPAKLALMRERSAEFIEPNVSTEEMEHIRTVFAQVDELLARRHQQRSLTHGDLFPGHVLWDGGAGVGGGAGGVGTGAGGSVGVIDFSDMTVGDPALDYAHFASISPELPAAVARQAEVHYRKRAAARNLPDRPLYGTDGTDGTNGADAADGAEDVLRRAAIYKQWDDIFLLIDHYRTGRSPRPKLV